MAHKIILGFLAVLILGAYSEESVKRTIELCQNKSPSRHLIPRSPNNYQMKDLLHSTTMKEEIKNIKSNDESSADNILGNKTPVLGSSDVVTSTDHDAGLLSSILVAYNGHFNLRTGPEDWWYTIIQTVAVAIDDNADKTEVRNFFVQHEGKKTLTVTTGPSIYGVNYDWFFEQMSDEIAKNINVPEYVDKMTSDFSTSTKVHRIASRIVLMKSVEEYFEYLQYLLCGIPSIEMKGTLEDWQRLKMKIGELREVLKPIENIIGLQNWWGKVEKIASKLLDTYMGNPDQDWWSRIITKESFGSGSDQIFKGWFMVDLLNIPQFLRGSISNAPSGLVTVNMTITDGTTKEASALIAGMVGYKFHTKPYYAVEPMHGWSLNLEPNSAFRNDLNNWKSQNNIV